VKNSDDKKKSPWLNSTVAGASLTSFLSDLSHEVVTVLLPSFLMALGAPAYALGIIEGVSDGLSSFAKLFAGYYADKLGRRKEFAFWGYVTTGIFPAIAALSTTWPMVLFARGLGWIGRGIRGPPRDAILAKSVEQKDLGKAFGLHRAGDTLGAIAGPVVAFLLLSYAGIKDIFLLAAVPGMLAAAVFFLLVHEKNPAPSGNNKTLIGSMKGFSSSFKRFLAAVLVFGVADFSHTLLIAFVVASLTPSIGFIQASATGILLYTVRNIVYAAASYPFGALGDRFGRRKILGAGYIVAVLTFVGFMVAPPNIFAYALLFAMAGLFIAAEDCLEGAITGELVEEKERAFGFGALATANGIGDFASSIIIGALWAVYGYPAGFAFSAVVGSIGAIALMWPEKQV